MSRQLNIEFLVPVGDMVLGYLPFITRESLFCSLFCFDFILIWTCLWLCIDRRRGNSNVTHWSCILFAWTGHVDVVWETISVFISYNSSAVPVLIWKLDHNCACWCPGTVCHALWPSGAIWHHWSWSTLVQVMAWCLMAPSHYLNQSWLMD